MIYSSFFAFYPMIRKRFWIRFIFKGKFSGKGNNKKKVWKLKNENITFTKKRQKNIVVISSNRTHHGAISAKTIF